nr:hypothetical protein [Tanacetum cinerariifolium]
MNQNFYNSNSLGFDQSQPSQFRVIHQPPQEMSIQEMKDLKQQYLDEIKRLINSKHRDEIKIDELKGNFNRMSIEINKKEKLQQLEQDYTVVITPDFPITDSLIMENEHLDTISETESDESIKSSVENLVSIPSDDAESSDEEVIYEISFKTYSNPLFDLDEEIISSEFNLIHNEDLDSTPKNDRFDTKSYLFEPLLNRDESIPPGIDSDNSYSEGDNLFLEILLYDDPIPLPNTLDFSNVVRVFLPFFTYPVTSSILLFSGSENTIFDPGIFDYHFYSLEPGVSHRSGTFIKFNKSPMAILSSTCSPMDQ